MHAPDASELDPREAPSQRVPAGVIRGITWMISRPILRAGVPVERQRRWLARIGRISRAPRGVEYRDGTSGGVAGESAIAMRARPPERAILYLHGGGYCVGAPAASRVITGNLAQRCAAWVFAADYRLAPEHPFPAAVDDAVAAYRGLLDEGVAPGAAVIAGDSAGGGLAVATVLRLKELGLPQPAALVLFSPWVDLRLSALGPRPPGEVVITRAWLAACANHYLAGHPADDPLASPIGADLRGLPPALIQVGEDELLLTDARRLHAALVAAGVESVLQEYPRRWHVFQQNAGVLADADRALDAVAAFVGSCVGAAEAGQNPVP